MLRNAIIKFYWWDSYYGGSRKLEFSFRPFNKFTYESSVTPSGTIVHTSWSLKIMRRMSYESETDDSQFPMIVQLKEVSRYKSLPSVTACQKSFTQISSNGTNLQNWSVFPIVILLFPKTNLLLIYNWIVFSGSVAIKLIASVIEFD